MCGRYTLIHNPGSIAQALQVRVPASLRTTPRYNIAPTQDIVTVMHDTDTHLDLLRWGLIPSWAKDASIGSRMINARAETLAEKASFRRLLHSKRCLIVADGFYEWAKESGSKSKTPMYIQMQDQAPFTFAGLWDTWKNPEGQQLRTCTIITTDANELMAPIHNRMPVILSPEEREQWLDPQIHDNQILLPLLKPYTASAMMVRAVSRMVNDPKHDSAELIA
ncbi:MAG TPA: SOS response-associated peptidase [Dictyobacter sp.]|nr:SOS response-associated peptidase [Dictyobacter sp.]